MYLKNKWASVFYKLILLMGCGYGMASTIGIGSGEAQWGSLAYYTMLSNLVCFLYIGLMLILTLAQRDPTRRFQSFALEQGAVTVAIMLTFVVYHFILLPTTFQMTEVAPPSSLSNIMVHYFTPWMVFGDYLLFCPKGKFRWFDPFVWLSIPALYLIFVMVWAGLGKTFPIGNSSYPYYFIDYQALGLQQFAINVALIGAGILVLGYMLYGVDKFLGYYGKSREKDHRK